MCKEQTSYKLALSSLPPAAGTPEQPSTQTGNTVASDITALFRIHIPQDAAHILEYLTQLVGNANWTVLETVLETDSTCTDTWAPIAAILT